MQMRRGFSAALAALILLAPAIAFAQSAPFQPSPAQDFTQNKGGVLPANQGQPAPAASAWPTYLTLGGLPNSLANPIFVQIAGGGGGGGGSSGLPAGASTSALQQQILAALGTPSQTADITALLAKNEAIRALLAGTLSVSNPGAPTLAGQTSGNATLSSLLSALGTPAQTSDITGLLAKNEAIRVLLATPSTFNQTYVGNETVRGGTIATGGTAQTMAAADATRRGFRFENQSTGDEYFRCDGSAATMDFNSVKVPSGAAYSSETNHVDQRACSVIGAATGQPVHFNTW